MGAVALWVPALLGVLAVCTESTRGMGSDHTIVWVQRLCSLTHLRHLNLLDINHDLRKAGHLFGYGALGILFTRIWLAAIIKWLRLAGIRLRVFSAIAGVVTTAFIASLDELHQRFLPNRTSSVEDVVLDTLGGLLLISAWLLVKLLRLRHTGARSIWPEDQRRRGADAQDASSAVSPSADLDGPSFLDAGSLVLES